MARLRLRKLSRDIHLWIGVGLFLVLAPLGVTGSWLVFDEPLDRMMHPQRYAVAAAAEPLAPSAYIDSARQAFGGRAAPAQLRLPQEPGAPVVVSSAQGLQAWIDPASAKVLDLGNPRRELRGFMHQLHGNLFLAQTGRKLVGWLGVVMLVSCVTGLVIWWPRNNAFLKALRWRRSPSVNSNLHHMVGFWIAIPLAVLSLTGSAIAFPEVVRAFSGAPAPRGPGGPGGPQGGPRGVAAPLAQPHLTVDAAVAAAVEAAGPGRVQQVALPAAADPRPAWRVQLRGRGAPVQVRVDDASGAARVQPGGSQGRGGPGGPGGGDPFMRLMRQIHDGRGAGPLWQAIIVAGGLAPALLGVTGVVLWLMRRRPAR